MSHQQEQMRGLITTIFRAFLTLSIGFMGWFGNKIMDKLENIEDATVVIRIEQAKFSQTLDDHSRRINLIERKIWRGTSIEGSE